LKSGGFNPNRDELGRFASGGGGGAGSGELDALSSSLGEGVQVGKTVGGMTNVQSTTGKGLTSKQVDTCISKMKKGDSVDVVFTAMTGSGDNARGKSMSGVVTGFGKIKGTDRPAAIIDATGGDLGKGQKTISSLSSIHNVAWGKT
jgi:hypothetical protein